MLIELNENAEWVRPTLLIISKLYTKNILDFYKLKLKSAWFVALLLRQHSSRLLCLIIVTLCVINDGI